MGVVKNIIAAIASTNALVAATCVNECWKLMSGCCKTINDYFIWVKLEFILIHDLMINLMIV